MPTDDQPGFQPYEHFTPLGGNEYLEVKYRVIWFRHAHPDGYIRTELVRYEHELGLAIFRAQAGYFVYVGERRVTEETAEGGTLTTTEPIYHEVYATGYGTELRATFEDFTEKSETRAIGRALAMLGYGTAQALELDEGRHVVDSPVARSSAPRTAVSPEVAATPPTVVPAPVSSREEALALLEGLLAADSDAVGKLPKPPALMSPSELDKTVGWLRQRARTLRVTGSALAAQSIVVPGAPAVAGTPPAPTPALSVVPPPEGAADAPADAPTDAARTSAGETPPASVHEWLGRAARVAAWLENYKSKHPGRLPSDLSAANLVNLQEVYRLGHQHLSFVQLEADPVDSLTPAALAPAIVDAAYMLCDHYHIHYPEPLAARASAS